MNLKAQAAKNVGAIWLNLLVHGLVGLFLSPFILHRLGDELFSLWVLIFSLSGYCGLLDLGIRSAVVRYTAKVVQLEDREGLARIVSTSLGFYAGMAMLSLLLTGVGWFYLPVLFKLPSADLNSARVLLLMAGTGVALSFPLNVFIAILEALQRFTYLGIGQLAVTLLRAIAIVIALGCGGKLLAVGSITVGVNLLSSVLFTWIACTLLPIRVSISLIDRTCFRKMIAYGTLAFLILVAEKLRFQSDVMIIGAFLSASAITSFSVAAKLVEYSGYAVRGMAQIYMPLSSQYHAADDYARLRRTLVTGNFACALISFPLCVTLVVLGRSILEVWVGPRYISSYPILVLLAISRSLYLAQSASPKLLMGMGEHGRLAYVLLIEGIANVVLSILLATRLGLLGVALGTAIPLVATSVFFLPFHVGTRLQMPISTYLRQAYLLPAFLCLPVAFALCLVQRQFPAHNLRGLMVNIAFGALSYAAGIGSVMFNRARSSGSWKNWVQIFEPR